jgi:SAM-dependent methyltransferase
MRAGAPRRAAPGWLGAAVLPAILSLSAPADASALEQAAVPYVPTPWPVVDAMLELARVGPRDTVIDLGSGDGRLVIAAARRHGARGYGVDIDPALVRAARQAARREGVADRVAFAEEDLFITEIGQASVMMLYLFPSVMMQLRPRFLAELKPGTRIVSHEFDMEDWTPDAHRTIPVPDKPYGPPRSEVYLWVVPASVAGDWRWRAAGADGDVELALTQRFQVLAGSPRIGGRTGRLEDGRVRGDRIRFILHSDAGGRAERREYEGRVSGDTISGTVRHEGVESAWQAMRVKKP